MKPYTQLTKNCEISIPPTAGGVIITCLSGGRPYQTEQVFE
ncbi:hypothetical protein HanXRQr2_Chr11g0520061 [Helianthus annuus]|uniref:Uncharacterized protein n=1 Tax=Helianthus annuus TaxID=4232 RepID=A0A9K3HUK5_HELAN|nr:hypothetical protein HanXRQr2_Chr11g0520061 [Helianthus annuus]